jgi:hypothetical protein
VGCGKAVIELQYGAGYLEISVTTIYIWSVHKVEQKMSRNRTADITATLLYICDGDTNMAIQCYLVSDQ